MKKFLLLRLVSCFKRGKDKGKLISFLCMLPMVYLPTLTSRVHQEDVHFFISIYVNWYRQPISVQL